ncbi:MAG: hypothetical protein HQK81_07225 [Desulfovibrionaceae bacterium]|nr:hypothetical protein [Desulfovibrionaceae bacterium]MBF0513843.1 hypothetical protein [Desulfovibrionaceae bacterium]
MPSAAPALNKAPAYARRFLAAAACALALAAVSVQAQPAAGKSASYSDPKYLFRLTYPTGWRQVQSDVPSTVLALDNGAAGAGRQTVSVRVYALADSNYADPAEFVFQFLNGVEEGGGLDGLTENHPLKALHPDVKAVEYGESSAGGASAFYIVSQYQNKEDGAAIPWMAVQLLTMRGDDVFELSYSASAADFPKQKPALTAIVETFAFE